MRENEYRLLLRHNETNRLNLPLWKIVLLAFYLTWQMGVVFYSSTALSLYGQARLPVDADLSSIVIIAAYLISAIVLFLCKNYSVKILRAVMLVSLVSSCLMFFAPNDNILTLLFYIQAFCCVFMICGYILIVIEFFTPSSELKRIPIAVFIYACLACAMYHTGVNLPYSVFNAIGIFCQVCVLIFLFSIPGKPTVKFIKKDFKIKRPVVMTFGFLFMGAAIGMIICFASSIAESVHNGMSTYYFSMAFGALFFALVRRKMNVAKVYKILVLLMALGFVCALASLGVPAFSYAACAILGFSLVAGEMYTYFGLFLFSSYPSRAFAPLMVIFTVPAAVIPMLLLELFRDNLLILYVIYGVISVTVVFVYLVFEPYFVYEFEHNSVTKSDETNSNEPEIKEPEKPFEILSEQENNLALLILQGYTESSISELMNITVNTQKSYRKSIYSKLNIHSKRELFELAEKQK